MTKMAKKRMLDLVPIWKDISENETSSFAGVDSSRLWRRRLDSDKS